MKEIYNNLLQNKNFLMFAATVSYILGLFAYFTDNPVLFAGIVTLGFVLLIIKNFPIKLVLVWIGIFYFGFLNANFRIKNYDELYKLAPSDVVVQGQIVSIPNSNNKKLQKFFFEVENLTINGNTYNNIKNKTLVGVNDYRENPDFSNLVIGDYYEIKGKLRRPFISTNPSQFSYAGYLRNFQTFTTLYADNNDIKIYNHKKSARWKFIQYLNKKRNNIISKHSKYLKSPNIDILGGVVFGDDAVAPPDYIKTSFIHSGLLHILAASGMNVAFISSFLFFFMIKLRVPYNIQMIVGIFATILYCLMTGLGASVIRAGLMLIFVLFGKLISRDSNSIALLSFVGLIMLIYNPAFINDVGFQLSFIVTLGILLSADAIMQYTKWLHPLIAGSIFVPIIAQIWVIPIQMFYFNTVSSYSVFANIITMPFLSVISFGGFISSLFALCNPIADFVCKWFDIIINPCLNVLVSVSDYIAKLPHSLIYTTHPSVFQILMYYIILWVFIWLIKTKFENKKILTYTLLLSFILFLTATIHIPNHNFEVISFDVGNADAFLIKSPQNKYFIIDTGKLGYNGGKSQADILIIKYLRDRGIKEIEGLIITHFDADHSGGAVDLISNLKIKNVYMNSLNDNKRLAKNIYNTINKNKFSKPVLAKNNVEIYTEPNFSIKIYKADIPQHGHDSEANENSVITLIKSDKTSMLFTGDAGVRAFNIIKKDIPQNVTILKVGHHGAKNVVDRDMLKYLNPQISLISVGYNKYGHPNPLTIKLLSNSKIVRTDKINAIKIISDKKGCEVDGYDSKAKKFYKKYIIKY